MFFKYKKSTIKDQQKKKKKGKLNVKNAGVVPPSGRR